MPWLARYRTRRYGTALLLAAARAVVGAARGAQEGQPELSWYTNPDDGGQAEIARRCTESARCSVGWWRRTPRST